nr:ribbon-helix-helix domain-containing protein [uncultured Halomonas sp.]
MSGKIVVSLPVSESKARRLDTLCEATHRSRSYLLKVALNEYLEREAWQIGEVRKAVEKAYGGDFADDAQVEHVFGKWLDREG